MKRLVISIAMAILPMLIFGQECFTNGTEWKMMIRSIEYQPKTSFEISKLDGMVNINGYDAFKMYCEYENKPDSKTLLYYVRTEGDKVFFKLPDDDSEEWYLMYDFGLAVGEGCYIYNPTFTISFKKLYKTYLKCISITKDETSDNTIMGMEEYKDDTFELLRGEGEWIKGISSTLGINYNTGFGRTGGEFRLIEVKNGDRVFYSDNTTSISKVSNAPLRYRVDGLNINLSGTEVSDNIQVYYTNGALLGNFTANGNSIDISVPNSGMYILKIKNTTISIHVPAV
ncbi:hypothetical protein [Prevotella sp.]|uniref:hypothetical protein n=1 Tax=Prevotella sp. TaxID=59823 RepID=UPI0030796D35